MNTPLVSIYCVTFNHAKYIRLCLESFIMQKTNFPFEVLIHDDASTDGTQDIIMEYQQKFPEIIKPVYQKENQFEKNVNICEFNFKRVKGKYVALCEGDDYWIDENKLQIQVDFMENHPECSVCFHPVMITHEDKSKQNSIFPTREHRFNKTVLSLEDLLKTNFIQTNSVMYRWAFYGKEYRAFVPQGIMPKDWYIHLFHAQFGIICFIDKCMAVYYRHDDSVWSGNVLLKHGIKHIKFFEAVWENIAVNKRLYFCLHVIPFVKQVYDVFKKNNYIDGLNFIENNSNWRNISMQKIYIWGAGHYGVLTALDYEQKGIEIKAFIDKNANEVKTRLGLPVLEFNEAMCNENKDFQIIIAVQNETAIKEIIEKLQSLGLKKNKDFCISPLISYFSEPPALALSSIQAILDSKAFIKLHLGCGPVYKDGWINIDNNSDNNIQKLDLNLDLRKSLPFPDNSVNFIYNEHFFEHLTVEEGILAIIDFYRVLKIGGVMRIAMPNLERTVNNYLDENWKENLKEHFKKFGLTFIQTRAELINIGFRWWGHKWLYDWEELERRLKEAGCKKIKRCAIFESEHEELKNLETRNESTLIAEVMKI